MAAAVRRAAALAAILLSLLWAAPALACTPPPGGLPNYTIAQRVAAADVVLEGTVDSLSTSNFPGDTATLIVLRMFKGAQAASVTIVGFGPTSLCRSPVQVSDHLVFFAKNTPNGLVASYLSQFDATAPATQETIDQVIAALSILPRAYLPMVAKIAASPDAGGASRAPLLAGPAALALIAGISLRHRGRARHGRLPMPG